MVIEMSVIVSAAPKSCERKGMIVYHSEDDFILFRILLYSVPLLQKCWGAPESTSQSTSESHRFAFTQFKSFWKLLAGSGLLFRIAELLNYDFRTIIHFADQLSESIKARQQCVRNCTNCVNLWKLSKCARDQELGKRECVFSIMRWCLSTPGSPIYILPVIECILVIPISLYVYILRDLVNTRHINQN